MQSAENGARTGVFDILAAPPRPQPRPNEDVPVVDVPLTDNPDLPDPGGPGSTDVPVPGGDLPPSRPTDPDFA